MQRTLGPTHLDTLKATMNLGACYAWRGDYDQALPIIEEARRLSAMSLGERHPTTIQSLHLLAGVYDAVRPVHEALPLHLEVMARRRDVLGEDHPRTLTAMMDTAVAYLHSDNETEAIRLLEEALPALQTKLGDKHGASIQCMIHLGYAYLIADEPKEALTLLEAVDRLTSSPGVPQDQTFQGRTYLAEALLRTGEKEKGVEILEQILKLKRTHGADDPLATADALAETAYTYLNGHMFAEAERYLRESLEILPRQPDARQLAAIQRAISIGRCIGRTGQPRGSRGAVVVGRSWATRRTSRTAVSVAARSRSCGKANHSIL